MRICGIQMKVALKQTEYNYANAEDWIRKAVVAGTDVAVLPEMCKSGYLLIFFIFANYFSHSGNRSFQ